MSSPFGRGGAPRFTQNSLNSACMSPITRWYSAPKAAQLPGVGQRQPRVGRGEPRIPELQWVAGDDAHPGPAAGRDRGKRADVVLDDRVRLQLVEDLDQTIVDVARAVEERLPGGRHELLELLEGRLPEHGRRVADEVLPELAGLLLLLGGRRRGASAAPRTPSPPASRQTTPRSRRRPGGRGAEAPRRCRRSCWSARRRPPGRRRSSFPGLQPSSRVYVRAMDHLSIWATAVRR